MMKIMINPKESQYCFSWSLFTAYAANGVSHNIVIIALLSNSYVDISNILSITHLLISPVA